jgi:hypothetical protein
MMSEKGLYLLYYISILYKIAVGLGFESQPDHNDSYNPFFYSLSPRVSP